MKIKNNSLEVEKNFQNKPRTQLKIFFIFLKNFKMIIVKYLIFFQSI